jgi:hypothetical protein
MTDDLDLPESAWLAPAREVQVGDACHAVILPQTEAEATEERVLPRRFSLVAYAGYALVMRVFGAYSLVAPVAIAETTDDPDSFHQLLESGRHATEWVRLPQLGGAWDGPALALLFKPHTVLTSLLVHRRSASMSPDSRDRLARRIAFAFEP